MKKIISEFDADPRNDEDEDSDEAPDGVKSKRGRKPIPEQWTRVISISTDNLNDLRIFPLATDLLVEQGYEKSRKRAGEPEWEIFFSPKMYVEMHPNPELEKNRLNDDRMKRYGE